ncbi:hypothetical protein ACOME3_005339 [Neoechinorhynchus agilis]
MDPDRGERSIQRRLEEMSVARNHPGDPSNVVGGGTTGGEHGGRRRPRFGTELSEAFHVEDMDRLVDVGKSGVRVNVLSNFFTVEKLPSYKIFNYAVFFDPPCKSMFSMSKMVKMIARKHWENSVFSFSGQSVHLAHRIECAEHGDISYRGQVRMFDFRIQGKLSDSGVSTETCSIWNPAPDEAAEPIEEAIAKRRMRWYPQVKQADEDAWMKSAWRIELEGKTRRGRPERRFQDAGKGEEQRRKRRLEEMSIARNPPGDPSIVVGGGPAKMVNTKETPINIDNVKIVNCKVENTNNRGKISSNDHILLSANDEIVSCFENGQKRRVLKAKGKSYILACLNEYRKRCLVFYLLNFANGIKFEGVSRRSNQNALTLFRRPKLIFDFVTKTTKNRSLSRLNTEVAIYLQVNFQEFYISFLLRPKTIIADIRLMNEQQNGGKVDIEDFLDIIRKLGNETLPYQNVFIESSIISENVAVDTSQNNTAMTKGFTEVSKGYNFYITNELSYSFDDKCYGMCRVQINEVEELQSKWTKLRELNFICNARKLPTLQIPLNEKHVNVLSRENSASNRLHSRKVNCKRTSGNKINSIEKSRTLRTELCTDKCRQKCLGDYSRLSKHGKVAFSRGKCLSSCKNECIELPQRTRFELSYRFENSGYNKEKKGTNDNGEYNLISADFHKRLVRLKTYKKMWGIRMIEKSNGLERLNECRQRCLKLCSIKCVQFGSYERQHRNYILTESNLQIEKGSASIMDSKSLMTQSLIIETQQINDKAVTLKADKSSSFKTGETYISKVFKLKARKTGAIESRDGSLVLGVLAEIYTLPSANLFDLNENLNPEIANEICLQVKARDERLRTEMITIKEAKKYEPNLTVLGNNEDTEISNNIDAKHDRAGDVEFEQTAKSPDSTTSKIESEPSIMNELPFPEIQTSINGEGEQMIIKVEKAASSSKSWTRTIKKFIGSFFSDKVTNQKSTIELKNSLDEKLSDRSEKFDFHEQIGSKLNQAEANSTKTVKYESIVNKFKESLESEEVHSDVNELSDDQNVNIFEKELSLLPSDKVVAKSKDAKPTEILKDEKDSDLTKEYELSELFKHVTSINEMDVPHETEDSTCVVNENIRESPSFLYDYD